MAYRRTRGDGAIKFRTTFRNTIYDVMRKRGWKETDSELDWDFHWADREWVYDVFDSIHLDHWQRVNHYRNGRELCRKDNLIKNIKRMKKQLEREGNMEEAAKYDFVPVTFVLPGDYALFVEEFKRHPGALWIMKPIGKAQGKGIFLLNKLSQIAQWKTDYRWKPENPSVEQYVVQRYIDNPYLVGGKKFDMRMYALVTCFQPLTVYIYRSGFARFSASRYSNSPTDVLNNFVHLTNVAIQKTSENYNADTGGKWELRGLKLHMISKFGHEAVNALFEATQMIIIRSLLAVQKVMISDKHCFELYGYDILFDDTLKPWLLEVNASPSLTANTREDYDLKFKLLNDMLDIVDMENRMTGDEVRVGGFDLVWRDGPYVHNKLSHYGSMLGADFDKRLNVVKPRGEGGAIPTALTTGAGSGGILIVPGVMSGTASGFASGRAVVTPEGGRRPGGKPSGASQAAVAVGSGASAAALGRVARKLK